MGCEWQETTLGEVIELKRGYDLPQQKRQPGIVPIVSSSGITDRHAESMVKGPGVVTGRYGTIGQVFFIAEDYWPLNTTLYVRDFKGNDPRFISYFLRTVDFFAYSDKAAVPGVNRNHLHQARVVLPSLPEQRAIASILSYLDDRIALLRETNATLEAIAQAIFKSWFVDFDPVKAKAEGREPEGMDAETAALFPSEFEESELGLIPKGWRVAPFSETVQIFGGGTPKTSIPEYWNGEIPWFSVVDAPSESDVFVIDTEKKITSVGVENSSTRLLPVGTTIISARGTVGKVAMTGVSMAMNQSCYGLHGKDTGNGFTYYSTRRLVATLKQHSHGAVFDTITRDTLAGVSIVVPPSTICDAYEASVEQVLLRIWTNLKTIQSLASLRDTLLPRLMTGQLRVSYVEETRS